MTKTENAKLSTTRNPQELQNCSLTEKIHRQKSSYAGSADIPVMYKDKVKQLPVVVEAGNGSHLLG